MRLEFNQEALAALADDAALEAFVGHLGEQVAERANTRARALFTDQGGGGVGSIESHIEHDERGLLARVGYPAEYFYMNLHEVGTQHERPRPHLRPALFGTKRSTGGKESAIRSVRQSKAAGKVTKRNRELAKARKAQQKGK